MLFVLLLTGAAGYFIGELSGGQETKIIVDLGIERGCSMFGVFSSRSSSAYGMVYKEI
jgi:hypothetical protein